MNLLLKLLMVYLTSAMELIAGVPAGLAMGLKPAPIAIAAALGGITSAAVITLTGERLRARLQERMQRRMSGSHGQSMRRIWDRYGLVGLGLLAPLLIGVPLGAAIAVALGAPTRQALFWFSLGTILWSIILTVAGTLGIAGVGTLTH